VPFSEKGDLILPKRLINGKYIFWSSGKKGKLSWKRHWHPNSFSVKEVGAKNLMRLDF